MLVRPGDPAARTWLAKSAAAARRALALDPMLAEGHVAMARLNIDAWNWNAAEEELKTAVRLNGNDAGARQFYAKFLATRGHFADAIAQVQQAATLDPKAAGMLGFLYLQAGSYREAQGEAEKILARGVNEFDGRWLMGSSLLGQGQVQQAERELERARKLNDRVTPMLADLARAYWRGGQRERALQLAQVIERAGPNETFQAATLYASLEQNDRALDLLEKAYAVRSPSLMSLNARREFRPLQGDPRFVRLQQRIGLGPVQ